MKKILFVINTMGHGGAENALLELIKRIDKKSYAVSLFVLTGQGELIEQLDSDVKLLNKSFNSSSVLDADGRKYLKKTVMKSLLQRGNLIRLLPYMTVNFFRMLFSGRVMAEKLLWRAISDGADRYDEQYDLAVSFLEGGSAYYVADHVNALKKAAFIHVDYGMAGYTRKLDRDCYIKYDTIFSVSDEVRESFLKVYPECVGKSDVFHNYLDADGIRKKSEMTDDMLEIWNKNRHRIRILTVGRLTEQKALDISEKACRLLTDMGFDICWFVLGEGNQRKKLEGLAEELSIADRFFMPGVVSNPYPYIKQADIYVHCSAFEGKSIAIQEAQILGKAMVVSDCSGNREQVRDREDGLMCDLNENLIAEKVSELLKDDRLRAELGKKAADKQNRFDTEPVKLLNIMK